MASRIPHAVFGVLCVVLTSCASSDAAAERHSQHAVAGAQAFYLSHQALKETELAARRGSAEAAIRLSEYHGFVRLDLERQIYWLKMAVRNGAKDEQENLDTLLEIQAEHRETRRHKTSDAS